MFKRLTGGQYYGELIPSDSFAGLILSETRYPASAHLPHHCHEHAYFCLIRQGSYREEYGGQQRSCDPLMLAFHPSEEVHAEQFDSEDVRSFNIEITPSWLRAVAGAASLHQQFDSHGGTLVGDFTHIPLSGLLGMSVATILLRQGSLLGGYDGGRAFTGRWVGSTSQMNI